MPNTNQPQSWWAILSFVWTIARALGLVAAVEDQVGIDIDGDGKRGTGSNASSASAMELGEGAEVLESKCDGNKRSLFVGINYTGQRGELKGCINDVENIKKFIVNRFQFPTDSANMRTLTDDGKNDGMPTKANIVRGMKWLVDGARTGDSLFIHYSGHGAFKKDVQPDTDEVDGNDETLMPVDYKTAGVIVDDDIHDMLVKNLPKGVRLTAIMDCCHSGSVFDLPYSYTVDGQLEIHEVDNRKVAIEAAIAAGRAWFSGDKQKMLTAGLTAITSFLKGPNATAPGAADRAVHVKTTLADVIQFSGCRDGQTSADANIGGEATGAMSWAFIDVLTKHGPKDITYTELLKKIRTSLNRKFRQVPCMSAGHKVHLAQSHFIM